MQDAQKYFFLMNRMTRAMKSGICSVIKDLPDCHFNLLHHLYVTIQRHGKDGIIYVSELTKIYDDIPQSISRMLRVLEKDGLIERNTDPNDRRKTYVRMTEKGIINHNQCDLVVKQYAQSIVEQLGQEKMDRIYQDWLDVALAIESVNMELRKE